MMTEDEETATAHYVASNVSTQLMIIHNGGRSGQLPPPKQSSAGVPHATAEHSQQV
jgi:hypothetical protein